MKIDNQEIIKFAQKIAMEKYKFYFNDSEKISTLIDTSFNLLKKNNIRKNSKEIRNVTSLVKSYYTGEYRDISNRTIMMFSITIIYFAIPFDVVTDFIPIFGYTDDVALILSTISMFKNELDKYVEFINTNGNTTRTDVVLSEYVIKDINDENLNEVIKDINDLQIKNIEIIDKTSENESSINNFFCYTYEDYALLIYNYIISQNTPRVIVTTDIIKDRIISPKFFEYQVCCEVMMNNQVYNELNLKYKVQIPYRKILNSDKKKSIKGTYYIVEYEKNNNIKKLFDDMYEWNIVESEVYSSYFLYTSFELITKDLFNKNMVESMINRLVSQMQHYKGYLCYKISMQSEYIIFDFHIEDKLHLNLIATSKLRRQYNEVLKYLEENIVKIINKKLK